MKKENEILGNASLSNDMLLDRVLQYLIKDNMPPTQPSNIALRQSSKKIATLQNTTNKKEINGEFVSENALKL